MSVLSSQATHMVKDAPPQKISRRPSTSSATSDSSSDLVDYHGTNSADPADSEVQPKTVRRGKDYRPTSTFYKKPFSQMTQAERLCHLATCPPDIHEIKPESIDRGPIPTQSLILENAFILASSLWPLAVQSASYHFYPELKWKLGYAYGFYLLAFISFALAVVSRLNYYSVRLGTFDEKNFSRDRTPDKSVNGLAKGILLYMLFRTALPFYLHYNKNTNVLTDFKWDFPLRLMAWELAMDYFFYVYHRTTHEVDALWFIHSHHHTTKHPTAILAILAGDYQEVLEIAIVPSLASLLVPMTFSELYVTMCYTIYVEMLGHSGIRSVWRHPALFWLEAFGCGLMVEDHELHHRFGKSGKNYGKQSRFWDFIFGTRGERIECYGM